MFQTFLNIYRNILHNHLLLSCFSSIIPILIVVIAKIFFCKKFTNKAFSISLFILFAAFIYFSHIMINRDLYGFSSSFYKLTLLEKIYENISDLVVNNCIIIIKSSIVILPVIFISSLIYFIKTKDKSVFKKLFISIMIFAPFIYLSYPCHKLIKKPSDINAVFENDKYIANNTVLLPVKAVMARESAYFIAQQSLYTSHNSGYYRSTEFKQLADEFVKYKKMEGEIVGYSERDLEIFLYFEKFDELLNVLDKIEKRTNKINPYRVDVYIAKKDYQTALETINNINYLDNTGKYIYYTKIYAGLKQFDRAYEYLEKYKNSLDKNSGLGMYKKTKIYLDYKSGSIETAKSQYYNWVQNSIHPQPFEEYIESIERIEF